MNADLEGSRPEPAAAVDHRVDAASGLQINKQDGFSSRKLSVTKLITERQDEAGVVSARIVSHVVLLLLLVAAVALGRLSWTRWLATPALPAQTFKQRLFLLMPRSNPIASGVDRGFVRRQLPPLTVDTPDPTAEPAEMGQGGSMFVNAGFVTRGIDPEGSLEPVARTTAVTYTVRHGDSLWTIASKFDITQDTLWANNDLPSPDMLSVGDELTIPPIDGLMYTIRRGDTLAGLAQRYRTTVDAIVNYVPNGLSAGQEPVAGETIMIPGGVKPIPPRRVVSLTSAPPNALKGVGSFVMPATGNLTQGFQSGHPALDIGAPKGAPVFAADAGYVSFAGWHPWGYGYAVEIDHGNGFRTLYAHLSWYAPDLGQSVKRGELIGSVGSTYGSGGWSSGPHLHFEIIHNGAKRNPCVFLSCP